MRIKQYLHVLGECTGRKCGKVIDAIWKHGKVLKISRPARCDGVTGNPTANSHTGTPEEHVKVHIRHISWVTFVRSLPRFYSCYSYWRKCRARARKLQPLVIQVVKPGQSWIYTHTYKCGTFSRCSRPRLESRSRIFIRNILKWIKNGRFMLNVFDIFCVIILYFIFLGIKSILCLGENFFLRLVDRNPLIMNIFIIYHEHAMLRKNESDNFKFNVKFITRWVITLSVMYTLQYKIIGILKKLGMCLFKQIN